MKGRMEELLIGLIQGPPRVLEQRLPGMVGGGLGEEGAAGRCLL